MIFKRKKPKSSESATGQLPRKTVKQHQHVIAVAPESEAIGASAPAPRDNDPGSRDVTEDLVRRVVAAIDEWAFANDLNTMPRNVVFQQALSILNAVDRNLTPKK